MVKQWQKQQEEQQQQEAEQQRRQQQRQQQQQWRAQEQEQLQGRRAPPRWVVHLRQGVRSVCRDRSGGSPSISGARSGCRTW